MPPISGDEFDDTPHREVAEGFEGFDNKTDPRLLPAGMLQNGLNMWCQGDGFVETRPGLSLVSRIAQLAAGPATSEIRGMAYFDTPTYESLVLVAGEQLRELSAVSAVTASTLIATYATSSVEQISMVQMIDRIFFLRQGVLYTGIYSGGAWTITSITTFSSGAAMPAWSKIATQGFRVFLLEANGYQIYGSAVGAAAVAANWVATENIKVGSGDGDPGRALISGQGGFLTVLNARSAWQIDTSGATVASWTSRRITGLTGCVEGRTAVAIGQDVIFLSRYGVVSLGALADSISINPQNQISWPIQPYLDRINWANIAKSFATTWNDCYILAVPLDSETYPKHLLVYNLRTKRWMAPWKYDLNSETAYSGSTLPFTGFTAACTVNFGDKAETVLGDITGRIFRFDLTATTDEIIASSGQAISPFYCVTRTSDHGAPQSLKSPFAGEVTAKDSSTSYGVSLMLLRDGGALSTDGTADSANGRDLVGASSLGFGTGISRKRKNARALTRYREMALQLISVSGAGGVKIRSMAMEAFVDAPEIAT